MTNNKIPTNNNDTTKKSESTPQQTPHPFDAHTLMWILMFFAAYTIFSGLFAQKTPEISYTDFKKAVISNQVSSISFKGDQIYGIYIEKDADKTKTFHTVIPPTTDTNLMPVLETNKVNISAKSSADPQWLSILIGIVPWLLIIAFFIYSSRMLQQKMGGKDGFMGFSKSKARLFETKDNEINYDDVAGVEGAKQDLQEIIDYLKKPEEFNKLGAKMPRGILLMGPPGTGKTMLAKATAHEAGVPFFSISGSEFIEMFIGVGASRVRDLFKEARDKAPALIFIDEIDSVGRVRGTGLGGGNDEREQTLNQILAEMDGFSVGEAVVVLAATNRPDVLDPALLRPGRFDRKVTFELPQQEARIKILKVHTRKVPIELNFDYKELASMTVGFSGADLANLVNEAALSAARKKADTVTRDDFNQAHDKIIMGSERKDLLNPSERKRTAVHESGHAIAALFLPNSDPLRQVSIIPRGRALGATEQLPVEDRHNYTQSYLETRLSVMLGGRVAEKIVLDDTSSGASNDLEQATHLAKMMVTQWGMSDAIGPIHFKVGSEHPFLGYEIQQEKDFSEKTATTIDQEIYRIIKEAEQTTFAILLQHRDDLNRLVEELLNKETLDIHMIEAMLKPKD
ncbi:ATP-dependent zinc metalloprotease FtsH [Shewanella sp. MEBiC00475]|uniref:ATP-dependent zinc metalloprotease FtsH n=1 Tax=Shewanella sp. MEBiC00475 TaxID=2575361 RepID=UPI0010BFBD4B|nr:ATP-dependent zinc metalloprotease FtsH [Shewanella sp. MEBiC00475]